MSLFAKYNVDPNSKAGQRYKMTFMDHKFHDQLADEQAPSPRCPDDRYFLDDDGLCPNRRCARHTEKGWDS